MFWSHAVIPAMLDYIAQVYEYSPPELRRATIRQIRNHFLSGTLQLTPYRQRTIRLAGVIHSDSVQIIPSTSILVALLELCQGERREVVVVDLQGGDVIGRKAIESEMQECKIAVDVNGFSDFRVALLSEKTKNGRVVCM